MRQLRRNHSECGAPRSYQDQPFGIDAKTRRANRRVSPCTDVRAGDWVWRGDLLGAVGTTGNATGKLPYLHYVIATLVPYPWRITGEPQGWRKMFFLDPSAGLPSELIHCGRDRTIDGVSRTTRR